jgi:hypothetical protein
MSTILAKLLLVVVMSHGLRIIGRAAGPRWGALALGLPCTTAVALAGSGQDRGVAFSIAMADHCLVGLAGAVALPLAFAGTVGRGWRLGWAAAVAASAYFASALMARHLSPFLVGGCLGVATLAVMVGASLAARVPPADDEPDGRRPLSSSLTMVVRTVVPALCLLGVLAARDAVGPIASGLIGMFPGMGLTLLILTYMESGPGAAMRMARALPSGNFGMIAFLASFRFASPLAGLGWGMVIGYLAAVAVLAAVASLGVHWSWTSLPLGRRSKVVGPSQRWPRPGRIFLPAFEPLAAC